MGSEGATRLVSFITEQQRHWIRLQQGNAPEPKTIAGGIESCEFALEDLRVLCKQALKADRDKPGATGVWIDQGT